MVSTITITTIIITTTITTTIMMMKMGIGHQAISQPEVGRQLAVAAQDKVAREVRAQEIRAQGNLQLLRQDPRRSLRSSVTTTASRIQLRLKKMMTSEAHEAAIRCLVFYS